MIRLSKSYDFVKWGFSRCEMGSSDLQEFAAARPQNLYTCRSIVFCSRL
jgi:hypothetical protein